MHVQYADEAYYIGNSPATESYLSTKNIIQLSVKSGAAQFIRVTAFCPKIKLC